MSTRVLPVCGYPYFNRMSELRRRLQSQASSQSEPSAAAELVQGRTVRRNLFGPIDHEENLKFVQEELSKIAQTDRRRWNFDFQKEKPLEGRYVWKTTEEGKVPVAFEMPNLTAKLTRPDPLLGTSKINYVTTTNHRSGGTSAESDPAIELSLKAVSSGTTTILSAKPRLATSSSLSISCSSVENVISPVVFVDSGRPAQALGLTRNDVTLIKPRTTKQTKITEFLKIGKRPHSATEGKHDTAEAPPALKRARTSS